MADSVKKHLFQASTAVSVSSSAGKYYTDTNALWKILKPFALVKEIAPGWISFSKFFVDMAQKKRDA